MNQNNMKDFDGTMNDKKSMNSYKATKEGIDNTISLMSKAKGLTDQYIIKLLKDHNVKGIVPSHGGIIVSLLRYESLTMSELAKKIDKDPSTVTTLVKKLNKLEYVTFYKDDVDKRATRVSLTDEGRALETVFLDISKKLHDLLYYDISEQDKAIFRKTLDKVIDNFMNRLEK